MLGLSHSCLRPFVRKSLTTILCPAFSSVSSIVPRCAFASKPVSFCTSTASTTTTSSPIAVYRQPTVATSFLCPVQRRFSAAAGSNNSSGSSSKNEDDDHHETLGYHPSDSLTVKLKKVMSKYGPIVIAVHAVQWAAVWSSFYTLIQSGHGREVREFLDYMVSHLPFTYAQEGLGTTGAVAMAFVCTKIVGPLRIIITLAVTRAIAPYCIHHPLYKSLFKRKDSN